ncbi:MAG: RDD family protein [Desulfobulbaceae bacterium]|nr:RDD family protein [Desulfobulbaceae bacterium]HIJ79597.1 RDD family protein [Deltaproteobacteria bacterium]
MDEIELAADSAGSGEEMGGLVRAGLAARVMALLIDVFVVHLLYFCFFLLSCAVFWLGPFADLFSFFSFILLDLVFYFFTFPLFVALYFCVLHGWSGQTVGKIFMGLQVKNSAGGDLSWGQVFLRFVSFLLAMLPSGLGLLWAFVDDEGRGWHDRIALTRVVCLK